MKKHLRFLLLQVVVLLGLGLVFGWAWRKSQAARTLPALRAAPLEVAPRYDRPELVSNEDLRVVLDRLELPAALARANVGHLDHALRLWGAQGRVRSAESLSGPQMLRILLEDPIFRVFYGSPSRPLLVDDGANVRFRTLDGAFASPHVDHTLATLAEIGVDTRHPVETPRRGVELSEAIETSLRDFELYQRETEWSVLVFALYLESTSWVTRDRQTVTFDRLADRLMLARPAEGVGAGQHRLYTLTAVLEIDRLLAASRDRGLLSTDVRRRVLEFLGLATDRLVRNQHRLGFWNSAWPYEPPPSDLPSASRPDSLVDRLIVTGHALEWWALAPEDVLPPHDTLRRAAAWLIANVEGFEDDAVLENYSYLTHVGRALALWRGLDLHETKEGVLDRAKEST